MSRKNNGHRGGLAPSKYLTPEEVGSLLAFVQARTRTSKAKKHRDDHLIVDLMTGAGLRAADVCDMRIKDTPTHHKKQVVYVRNGKGQVSRAIDISSALAQHIQEYVAEYRTDAKPGDPLILARTGKPISYMTIYQKIVKIGKDMGMPDTLHPHKLRHSFAVRLYAVENDLLFVSQQLGHSDVSTTQIYARTTPKAARRQMEAL